MRPDKRNQLKDTGAILFCLVLWITAWCRPGQSIRNLDERSFTAGKVKYAGVRSSSYGIKPFPEPSEWQRAMEKISGYFAGSTPCGIWIVGKLHWPKECFLEFPSDGHAYTNIIFDHTDRHEKYLSHFDRTGIKVFLQVEPASADVATLIDLVLNRYKHHECILGFGIDVEWYREFENPQWGVKVDDVTAERWEARVKSHNSDYRIFLKHWDRTWMPKHYRGDIVFVNDSQMLESLDKMLDEFVNGWARHFHPNSVFFQIGYSSDKPWWQNLKDPPKNIGEAIAKRAEQTCGIFWVDFTLRDILPTSK